MKKLMLLTLVVAVIALGSGTASAQFNPPAPTSVNFYNDYQALYAALSPGGLLYSLLSGSASTWKQVSPLVGALSPATADINGGFDSSTTPITIFGNGMLDCNYELAIITSICAKPAGAQCASVTVNAGKTTWKRDDIYNAWIPNMNTLHSQAGSYVSLVDTMPTLELPLFDIIVGLVMLGDTTTNAVVTQLAGLLPGGTFSLASYATFPYLAKAGDADGDGYTNYQEYVQFSGTVAGQTPTPGTYLSAVLDPTIPVQTDPSKTDTDGDGLTDLIETSITHTNPYLADTDGDGFGDGMEVLVYGTDPNNPDLAPKTGGIYTGQPGYPSPVPATDFAGIAMLVSLIGLVGVGVGLRRAYSVK